MTSSPPVKILLADDHNVTRLGIKFMLDESDEITVVGEAINGVEAVSLFAECRPDIVLMDVDMPELDGIQAAASIKRSFSEAKVIMMTSSKDKRHIFASLAAGANGYCTKDVTKARLLAAIKSVMAGDMWLDSSIANTILQLIPDCSESESGSTAGKTEAPLTEREIEVLKLLVEGLNNTQIGKHLFITTDTVKTHIKHILDKLAVTDRTQAAVKAIKQGLI
jgi:DNA-binding NarL/FixJ family response regulator